MKRYPPHTYESLRPAYEAWVRFSALYPKTAARVVRRVRLKLARRIGTEMPERTPAEAGVLEEAG